MQSAEAKRAVACVGAMVGAGFASGREIIAFFSQYGAYSWGLILLSATAMCLLFMALSRRHPGQAAMRPVSARLCKAFRMLLLAVTGGAMMSACGEVAALMLPIRAAYPLGVVVCMLVAYWLSGKSLRPLTYASWGLMALLFVAIVALLACAKESPQPVLLEPKTTLARGAKGAVFAVGYACLNVSLSMGVVCGDPCRDRNRFRAGVWFALLMAALMFLYNYLCLQHPSVRDAALPIVKLLSAFGRAGFWTGAALLLLALMTSQIGVLRGLRCEMPVGMRPALTNALVLLPPLLISMVGFSQIVGVLYPYLGLLCIVFVYLPMLLRPRERA